MLKLIVTDFSVIYFMVQCKFTHFTVINVIRHLYCYKKSGPFVSPIKSVKLPLIATSVSFSVFTLLRLRRGTGMASVWS